MATFTYKASTAAGEVRTGTMIAADERLVVARLRTQGLIPLAVGAGTAGATQLSDVAPVAGWRGKLRMDVQALRSRSRSMAADRLEFTQEIATLISSGVPLDRALRISGQLSSSEKFRAIIADVLRQIQGGKSLADALGAHPAVFSRLYVNMVRAGQASGALGEVFPRLADHETREAEFRSHIISSMIYPILLVCVALASLVIMMYVVIPRFAEVFATTGIPMPASTAALLWVSGVLRDYGLYLLVGAVAGGVLIRRWARSPQGRTQIDRALLRTPLLGDLLLKAETGRLARTMSTLVGHGVPIVDSLKIVRETIGNSQIAGSMEGIMQGVKRGEGVAGPIERAGILPALAVHLIRVGEETGKLDAMFERMANIYENETRTALRRVTALFEPAIILIMGIGIGGIVLSLLMAISSINEIPF